MARERIKPDTCSLVFYMMTVGLMSFWEARPLSPLLKLTRIIRGRYAPEINLERSEGM